MPKAPSKKVPAKAPTTGAAPAKAAAKSGPVFEKKTRNFSVGGAIQPRVDLSRMVRWPKYVRLQRCRKVLYQRLKVPPTINQFSSTLDKSTKQERLTAMAAAKESGESVKANKPYSIKYG